MNIQKQNLGLLGSFVILVAVLVGNSSAEFYWKDNKIVRQAELANDILLKDTPITLQSTLNSLNSVNSIVVGDAQKQLATQAGIVPQPTQMPVVNDLQSIKFDCTGKPTGPNKDPKYCDVYHACVFGKQSKVYSCEQMGERFYYDENLQRCEFASNNPQACPSNTYFQSVRTQLAPISRQYGQDTSNSNSYSASQPSSQSSYSAAATGGSGTQYGASQYPSSYPSGGSSYPSGGSSYPSGGSGGSQYPSSAGQTLAPWQQYVEQNEQFSCQGKQDGFYPSKWCNVFYRCFYGIKSDFLCAMNNDGARLWWTAHSTSQAVPQQSAQCVFPCQQKRQCTSPGGVLMDGPTPSDSPQAAQQILSSCPVNANYNPNPSGVPVPDNSNDQVRIPDGNNYCQGAPDGVQIADPNFCNVFHVCIAGIRKDQVCAKGPGGQYDLWWNDATKRCDYPCTTQCSKGIYGSQANAQQIQSMDRAMNPSMCGGSSSYPSGGSSGSYPSGGSSYPSYGSSSYGGSSSGSAAAPSYGSSSGSSYPSSSGSSSYGASPSYSSSGSSSSYGASPSYSSSGSSSSYAQPAQQPSYGSSQSSYTYGTTQQSQNYGSGSGSYGTSQQSYGK